MKRKGIANLPLHGGHPPRWLFSRMIKLAGGISEVIIDEYGSDELLRRLSNPFWFQAFSCVLGFDWHSSGTTTTTCGALKIALKWEEHGILVAGGKGKNSRKTPQEILDSQNLFSISTKKIEKMVQSSRISAKIDNSCIQDGYQLYQHNFFLNEKGNWAVVQQGMNNFNNYARRYHWLGEEVDTYIEEPHSAISCDSCEKKVLNMTATGSDDARQISVDLICDNPDHIRKYFRYKGGVQMLISDFSNDYQELNMPNHHPVLDMDLSDNEFEVLKQAWEIQPENYEELILLKGLGPKKIRALALISDLVFGKPASWKDPVKYSFTHGGKDGFPYPVDREVYDNSINTLKEALDQSQLENKQKISAIKRLEDFLNE
ncbi:DUF763 domain-containing protein [Methanobacterium alcaliphilum]|uniref:DUF763 domain-containing protein n=1 Tax=Methanobacterium alcaliphilum TaxID=392018 RepID=UPI00200A359C|nr:DUF763 domain-containing protein [Methanobacterium alcaliphilum]MCK9150625.1 DUF763 domain-containing protein [Methanobacterium alcaliphilum]